MTKGQIFQKYKDLSPQDRRTFDLWLRGNAVVGALMAMAMMAIVLNGSRAPSPSAKQATQAVTTSLQQLHSLAHLENLPVDYIEDYALTFAAPKHEDLAATKAD